MNLYRKVKELEGAHSGQILAEGYDMKYSDWVLRHLLQKDLGISSVNTIKKYVSELKDKQLIDTYWTPDRPKGFLIKTKDTEMIGINRVSIGYQEGVRSFQLIGIDRLMTPYLTAIKTGEFRNIRFEANYYDEVCSKMEKFEKIMTSFFDHLIGISLTGVNSSPDPDTPLNLDELRSFLLDRKDKSMTKDDILSKGFSENSLDKWIKEGSIIENPAGVYRLP